MKNLLPTNTIWADNAEMYKELVNRRVFRSGYPQYEQLDQMCEKCASPS